MSLIRKSCVVELRFVAVHDLAVEFLFPVTPPGLIGGIHVSEESEADVRVGEMNLQYMFVTRVHNHVTLTC